MRRKLLTTFLLCLAAGSLTFLTTVLAKPAGSNDAAKATVENPALIWLGISPAQRAEIEQDDPRFADESSGLMAELLRARQALAALLESSTAGDQQILDQVDLVNEIEHRLERRVTQYVLRVRHHLTADQQKRLMGLCAQGFQGHGRCRGVLKYGSTTQPTQGDQAPAGGRGMGGRGPGPHRGPPD